MDDIKFGNQRIACKVDEKLTTARNRTVMRYSIQTLTPSGATCPGDPLRPTAIRRQGGVPTGFWG